jgi:hypothetical protein
VKSAASRGCSGLNHRLPTAPPAVVRMQIQPGIRASRPTTALKISPLFPWFRLEERVAKYNRLAEIEITTHSDNVVDLQGEHGGHDAATGGARVGDREKP